MTAIRQSSFAGGELSPDLHQRTDLPAHAQGLARCFNFMPLATGKLVSRPGMKFVAQAKTSPYSEGVRLLPFVYSDAESYVLEMGQNYVRFHRNGATVGGSSTPYEVATPYTTAQLPQLKYVQSGDVLFLTHEAHTPHTLKRLAETNWVLAPLTFGLAPPTHLPREPMHVGPPAAGDATHPKQVWQWKVTIVYLDSEGNVAETTPFTVTKYFEGVTPTRTETALTTSIALYPDMPATLSWEPDVPVVPPITILAYRVYRGRGKAFGYVGETTSTAFVDDGREPDYSFPAPQGTDPLAVTNYAGSVVRHEKPRVVSFYEQRLFLGGTNERPFTLLGSATGDFYNFDDIVPSTVNEAVQYDLAARRLEDIRSLVPLSNLLVFTGNSVWALDTGAASGGVATIRVQSEVGASWLQPVVLGDSVLYVRGKGSGVRDLAYDDNRGGFTGAELTSFARHLFEAYTVTDWAYAEDPHGLVWAVRHDGTFVTLTYDRAQGVVAWAQYETDGSVRSVCSVPEEGEDAVYFLVARNGVTCVERLATPPPGQIAETALDCYRESFDSPRVVVEGLEYLNGKQVTAVADGVPVPLLPVVGGQITLPFEASNVVVGLPFTPELESLDIAGGKSEVRTRMKAVTEVFWEVENTRGLMTGPDFQHLTEWQQRTVAHGYGLVPATSGLAHVRVAGSWTQSSRVVLRQTQPFPISVLGLIREVQLGG